jgi:Ca2+-binding EF-hand superfamily protein
MTNNEEIPPFQVAKLGRIFDMMDMDKDGQIEKKDMIEWGRQVCARSGIEYTSEKQKGWEEAWDLYFGNGIGTNGKDHYISALVEFSKMENALELSATANLKLFDCVDVNGDGVISWSEFKNYVGPVGIVDEEDAKFAFEMIDANGDGVLSKEEVCLACPKYYFDAEPTIFQHFYGKFDFKDDLLSA